MPASAKMPAIVQALPISLGGFDANSELSRNVLEISNDCVKVLDPGGNLLFMNHNGLCIMEIDDFDAVRGKPWPSLWPEPSRPVVQHAIDTAMRGNVGHFIAECPTAKGTVKWWDVTVTLVPQLDGGPMRMVSVSRDISAQKRLDDALHATNEQLNLVTREMAHRINNTLAVVQSLISQIARTTTDQAEFSTAIGLRIAAMAAANRALVNSDWDGADLERLIRQELAAHISEADPRLTIHGPATGLPSSALMSFALIIHELATNAVKHGALSGAQGQVELSWTVGDGVRAPGQESKKLSLLWREHGGPPVTPPRRKGFGSVLLERGIDDCKVERRFDPGGLVCRIEVPL